MERNAYFNRQEYVSKNLKKYVPEETTRPLRVLKKESYYENLRISFYTSFDHYNFLSIVLCFYTLY